MIIRKDHVAAISGRMNNLAEDRIVVKRIAEASQDGPLNAARSRTYTPELITHCDIKYGQDRRETAGGVKEDYDARVWIYNPAFSAGDRDIVNIGGTIHDGVVTGGTDYRIFHTEPYEDCVELKLRSL